MILVRGKGGHERVLPVSEETWEAVLRYLEDYPAGAGPLIRSYRQRSATLTADVSGMVSAWTAEAGLKRRARDGISGHALRHSAAGHMLRGGAHLRECKPRSDMPAPNHAAVPAHRGERSSLGHARPAIPLIREQAPGAA